MESGGPGGMLVGRLEQILDGLDPSGLMISVLLVPVEVVVGRGG